MATHYFQIYLVCWHVVLLSSHTRGVPVSLYGEEDASLDELIVNAANSTSEFEFFYDQKQKLVKVEYDIVYAQDEYTEMSEDEDVIDEMMDGMGDDMDDVMGGMEDEMEFLKRKKRTAAVVVGTKGTKRWTNATVLYEYNMGDFSDEEKAILQSAMDEWSAYTCLTFVESDSLPNRILFKNEGGCFSRVGMVGGVQVVGMAQNCRYKGVVLHEVGHALGLHHEQTRPDRDEHVTIISRNIPEPMKFNFQKYSWKTLKDLGIPYDYNSIMHYGKNAFSMNGKATIVTVNPAMQDTIGQKKGLSFRDIKTINIVYGCKKATAGCKKEDTSCPGEGYVGKDCKCWCPGSPIQLCSKGGGRTDGGGEAIKKKETAKKEIKGKGNNKECEDQHQSCSYWAGTGECSKNPAYMLLYCKASCKTCSQEKTDTSKREKKKTQKSSDCVDQHTSCSYWAGQGYCRQGFVSYMVTNCKKACERCPKTLPKAKAPPKTIKCADKNQYCGYWLSIGECTRNPVYMRRECPLSCKQCSSAASTSNNNNNNQNAAVHYSSSPKNNWAYSSSISYCMDNDYQCAGWARIGQCNGWNRVYMYRNCRRSCRLC